MDVGGDEAAALVLDADAFRGEDALQFLSGSQTDLEELDDSIRRIAARLAMLKAERKQLADEAQLVQHGYRALNHFYAECVALMPALQRTKKARSVKGKRGALKLAVPPALVPLCR